MNENSDNELENTAQTLSDIQDHDARQRLLEEFKLFHELLLKSNTELEEKGWNILRFTTAVIGVGAAVGLFEGPLDWLAQLGLGIALLAYLFQVRVMAMMSEPQELRGGPATPTALENGLDEFKASYYNTTDLDLVSQLVVNYAGSSKEDNQGVIETLKRQNAEKGDKLRLMSISLNAILLSITITFTLSAIGFSDWFQDAFNTITGLGL